MNRLDLNIFKRWVLLLAIAFGGSAVYGGFVGLSGIFPNANLGSSAILFTGAAGLSWAIFMPMMIQLTGIRWIEFVDEALQAMAWGELVLNAGVLMQVLLGYYRVEGVYGTIFLSNIVMMVYLANRLAQKGFPRWKTMGWWLFVQNGLFVLWIQMIQKWLEV